MCRRNDQYRRHPPAEKQRSKYSRLRESEHKKLKAVKSRLVVERLTNGNIATCWENEGVGAAINRMTQGTVGWEGRECGGW